MAPGNLKTAHAPRPHGPHAWLSRRFLGADAAEVLGDYGAGPNHVLPTGGTARYTGGLNVLTFIRIRTWMRIDRPEEASELLQDAESLGHLEGLDGHARSAAIRR